MKDLKKTSGLVLALYYLLTLASAVWCLARQPALYNILLALSALALPAAPWVLYRVLRWERVPLLEIVFYVFCFFAVGFASLLGGYDLIPIWDKLLHFFSGFLFAALGLVVYYACKPGREIEPREAAIPALFAWMFAVLSAVVWEIFEYVVSFFGPDPQKVAETGIHDTMGDMIVCLLGGLITGFACLRYVRSGGRARPRGLMMGLFSAVYETNLRPEKK